MVGEKALERFEDICEERGGININTCKACGFMSVCAIALEHFAKKK